VSLATSAAQRDLSERARAWVERACAEQGVPVKMTDPLALAEIADILLSGRKADFEGQGRPKLSVANDA
jgi:hypothetical protein